MTGVKILLVLCLAAVFVLETVSAQVWEWDNLGNIAIVILIDFSISLSELQQWRPVPRPGQWTRQLRDQDKPPVWGQKCVSNKF